ncbi:hypothetical protein HanIR_Chr04g0173581 [Helianthus annuus]|nr:hypothetical protein HanIR_Chr04g0173581 [Helianthus annuus]
MISKHQIPKCYYFQHTLERNKCNYIVLSCFEVLPQWNTYKLFRLETLNLNNHKLSKI